MKTLLIALKQDELTEPELTRVRELVPDMNVVVTGDRLEIERLLPDIEIAFGRFPAALLKDAPHLAWYQQWSAGADWLLREPELAGRDFTLTNASGVHSVPIAEHILAYMLAFARGLPQALRAQSSRTWKGEELDVFELAGKSLLLVGVGRIGLHTARLARALGMRTVGIRRSSADLPEELDSVHVTSELHDLLPDADFVVLTVPLTATTRHMFGRSEFEAMKTGAYLINIGRGATVDEPALVDALRTGLISGAGLDVFETEPLPEDSPLWHMNNVIITSHYAGNSPMYARRAAGIFLDNLERHVSGRELKNVVDKKAGY